MVFQRPGQARALRFCPRNDGLVLLTPPLSSTEREGKTTSQILRRPDTIGTPQNDLHICS
jgi:hypothetical protein